MNIFQQLKEDVVRLGRQIYDDPECLESISIEIPKEIMHGDLSTNAALIIAAKTGQKPRETALAFKEKLAQIPYIAHIEVAGQGFINLTIKADKWHECLRGILNHEGHIYILDSGLRRNDNGKQHKINVEYVSANPTGPMHIGHARCAVYGDALAVMLERCGFNVTKEYYVNDAGGQINDLLETALLRYEEALSGAKVKIPEGLYPGEYLIETGKRLLREFGRKLLDMPKPEQHKTVKKIVIEEMLDIIKADLKELNIEHDLFFSETSLHESGKIAKIVEELKKDGLIYEGTPPPPKGKIDENWQERRQLLFKSSAYGDDQDRPVTKTDGSWTYFAADLAYAKDKIERGFDTLIYILGADHGGYVKRINAVVQAISKGRVECNVKICQLVNFVENGTPVKMSKRAGNFTTVKDVIEAVGKDVIRFMMLTRKNDADLDFDLEKVKEYSRDNPVFYAQYAYVRTVSILANGRETTPLAYEKLNNGEFDLSLLDSEEEIRLIKTLTAWEKILEGAVKHYEPHRIAFYLLNLAAKFHSLWNLGKENNDYRFILEDNIELTAARLALTTGVQKILRSGFEIIGVTPMKKM